MINKNIASCKKQLRHVRKLCSHILPTAFELTFISYDRILFRLAKGITREKERIIRKQQEDQENSIFSPAMLFNRIIETNMTSPTLFKTDIRIMRNTADDRHAITTGLTFYETLQNAQESCIRRNVQKDTDMWVYLERENDRLFRELMQTGFVDEYGIFEIPPPENKIAFEGFMNTMRQYGLEPDWVHDVREAMF